MNYTSLDWKKKHLNKYEQICRLRCLQLKNSTMFSWGRNGKEDEKGKSKETIMFSVLYVAYHTSTTRGLSIISILFILLLLFYKCCFMLSIKRSFKVPLSLVECLNLYNSCLFSLLVRATIWLRHLVKKPLYRNAYTGQKCPQKGRNYL